MSESDWVTITHPETGGTGEVHQSSLPQHYAAGWRLLSDVPEPEPEPVPEPATRKQAAQAAQAKTESGEK